MKDFLVKSDDPDYIASVTQSDLTLKIKLSQNRRNAAYDKLTGKAVGTTKTLPRIDSVGLNLTASATSPNKLLDTAFLDEVFLRVDEDEFPSVNGGDDIGQFDYLNFGFEIILDGLGEGPTLKALRNTETVITLGPSPFGDVNKFKGEDQREQILNYIDPCAFYASFFFDGIQIKADSSDAKFVPKKKDGLFNEVLAKFLTRDTVYLDLRNEHNHGFNYYRNYNLLPNDYAQFYIKYDASTSVLTDYQSYGWPIFAISTSAFTSTDAKKPSTIVLNLPQGDNPAPMIYSAQGYFYTGFKRMSQPPDVKETLRSYIGFQADTFTEAIAFSIPKLANNATIPSYVNVRYLKKISSLAPPNPPVGALTLEAKHFLDNLFELTYLLDANGLKIPLDTDEITQWHVTGSTAVVDSSSGYGRDFMAKIGIGRDQSNIYFFAFTKAVNMATSSTSKTGFLPVLSKAHKTNIEFGYIEILDVNNVPQPMLTHNGLPDGIVDAASSLNADERSIVVLALDKDELPLIQNATISIEQTFDKRLALRNKHNYLDSNGNVTATEYDLFVIGYQFGTSVSVVAVNTQIKVRNKRATPRICSSRDAATNTELLDPVSENRKHFINSKIAKGTTVRLRSSPRLPKSTEPSNLVCETQGDEHRITILGKKKIIGDNKSDDVDNPEVEDRIWYYLELLDPIVVTDAPTTTTTILPKGMKVWAIADFYAVSTFENFIRDLIDLNEDIDLQQNPPESLVERITRVRQHTKDFKDGKDISLLFDAIIGAPAIPPPDTVRLHDPGTYETGPIVTFESVTDLETKIQLFEDYMGATTGNGQVIDLHHLFIGMDAMNHVNLNTEVDLGLVHWLGNLIFDQYLGSNINATTWSGDIGAIPGDYMVVPSEAPTSQGIDWRYQGYWRKKHPGASYEDRSAAFLEHYWETRAKDEDLFPDVYCHLIRERLIKYVLENPANRNVAALLYHFNFELTNEGDRHAFQVFARYLGLDPSNPLPYTNYPTIAERMKTDVYNFSVLWYYNKFHSYVIVADAPILTSLSERLTNRFLMWLDRHR